MINEKFKNVLQKDEEIKWSGKTKAISVILRKSPIIIAVSLFISFFASQLITMVRAKLSFEYILIVSPVLFVIIMIYFYLNARNTYFCITNKRIIKRSGAFNNKFIHYTLKNLGTISVSGGIFHGENCANLIIATKDFHNNSNGGRVGLNLSIPALNNAYEAYNLLSSMVEGNNESLRVKLEK